MMMYHFKVTGCSSVILKKGGKEMNELTINPNFHDLIPPLSAEEYQLLEESILKEGCRDPLVVWPQLPNKETSTTYILLDGHNRYEICRKHQIGFETLEKEFDTEDEAKIWIINNQLGRRNLTREQISYLIGLRYNLEKKEPDGFEDRDLSGDQNDHRGTAEKIAEETGVSAPTVRRNAKFAKAVDKLPAKEKEEVLAGKSKKTKKEIMRREMAKKDKIELGPPSNGMRFAKMAIMDVEKITEDDLEKEQGLYHVKEYLDRRIEDIDTDKQLKSMIKFQNSKKRRKN
jgi:ParB-like chromosome segregation protein Spo0J